MQGMETRGKQVAAPTAEEAWEVWVETAFMSSCLQIVLPSSSG